MSTYKLGSNTPLSMLLAATQWQVKWLPHNLYQQRGRVAGATSVTRRARAARSSSDSSSCPGFSVRPPPYAFDMSGGRGNMPHVATCAHTLNPPDYRWHVKYCSTPCDGARCQPAARKG